MELWHGTAGADFESAQDELRALGITDGLPVVPPTYERVSRMLDHGSFDADEVVTTLPPSFAKATWRDLAINAVMAGCLPDYLGIVGAAIAALSANEFNLVGIATTTGSAAPLLVVNGPIATKLDINCGATRWDRVRARMRRSGAP